MPPHQPVVLPAPPVGLCLGYANTRYWRGRAEPVETLAALPDLLDWAERHAGTPRDALAPWHEIAADTLLASALALRETLYRVFSAVADGADPAAADLAALNQALARAPRRDHLVRADTAHAWRIQPFEPGLASLLAPVLWSAGDLLARAGHHHVRRCANDECIWLFLDESKSGTRRWCDMSSCGNRAKARRHYHKIKST
jgi:predicted RNA-binding Zn ribbon-like protein